MSWKLLFVPLLLATAVVMADEVPEAKPEGTVDATTEKESEAKPELEAEGERPAADAETQAESDQGPKRVSGMSVLGNQEAPKSLVIVPWKSSEIGDAVGISTILDDSRQPVDREVFMRALSYYEIRSGKTP
jgi:hypothetical protein